MLEYKEGDGITTKFGKSAIKGFIWYNILLFVNASVSSFFSQMFPKKEKELETTGIIDYQKNPYTWMVNHLMNSHRIKVCLNDFTVDPEDLRKANEITVAYYKKFGMQCPVCDAWISKYSCECGFCETDLDDIADDLEEITGVNPRRDHYYDTGRKILQQELRRKEQPAPKLSKQSIIGGVIFALVGAIWLYSVLLCWIGLGFVTALIYCGVTVLIWKGLKHLVNKAKEALQ